MSLDADDGVAASCSTKRHQLREQKKKNWNHLYLELAHRFRYCWAHSGGRWIIGLINLTGLHTYTMYSYSWAHSLFFSTRDRIFFSPSALSLWWWIHVSAIENVHQVKMNTNNRTWAIHSCKWQPRERIMEHFYAWKIMMTVECRWNALRMMQQLTIHQSIEFDDDIYICGYWI